MMDKKMMAHKVKAQLSELEIYLQYGNERIRHEAKNALQHPILDKYHEKKNIGYLKKNIEELKIAHNYLEKKLLDIRDLN